MFVCCRSILPKNRSQISDEMGNQKSSPSRVRSRTPVNGSGIGAVGPLRAMAGVQGSAGAPRMPIPNDKDLDERFNEVIKSMNLQPEQITVLKNFPRDKKWDIVCDQERVQAKDPPSVYLGKLRAYYMDPTGTKKAKEQSTSTQVLRDLEISLRTNPIEWVQDFLDVTKNNGLDVLVDYLSHLLFVMRHLQLQSSEEQANSSGTLSSKNSSLLDDSRSLNQFWGSLKSNRSGANTSNRSDFDRARMSKYLRQSTKLKRGEAPDDVNLCIMCLRAIMNNKYGFNMVIQHKEAINCIALSLVSL